MHLSFLMFYFSAARSFIFLSFRAVLSAFWAFLSSRHSSALYCFFTVGLVSVTVSINKLFIHSFKSGRLISCSWRNRGIEPSFTIKQNTRCGRRRRRRRLRRLANESHVLACWTTRRCSCYRRTCVIATSRSRRLQVRRIFAAATSDVRVRVYTLPPLPAERTFPRRLAAWRSDSVVWCTNVVLPYVFAPGSKLRSV